MRKVGIETALNVADRNQLLSPTPPPRLFPARPSPDIENRGNSLR